MTDKQPWTVEKEGQAVLNAIKDAHRGQGTQFGRQVDAEDAARAAELARIEQKTRAAELEAARAEGELKARTERSAS